MLPTSPFGKFGPGCRVVAKALHQCRLAGSQLPRDVEDALARRKPACELFLGLASHRLFLRASLLILPRVLNIIVAKNPSKCLVMRLSHHITPAVHVFERQAVHNTALDDGREGVLLHSHQAADLLLRLGTHTGDLDAVAELLDVSAESLELGGIALGRVDQGM